MQYFLDYLSPLRFWIVHVFVALYNSYFTSGCPREWLQMLFLFYLFIWTGNVSMTFQVFWALHWQKTIHRQWWSNAHVMAEPGWFKGYICHFPFTLSSIFRPDALRIWPYPLPEQHTTLIPCGCKAWTEEHHTSSTSPSSCSSRLISSSGMAELLRILSCTLSTSTGTDCPVLLENVLFSSVGALAVSQVVHKWSFKCLTSFWEARC